MPDQSEDGSLLEKIPWVKLAVSAYKELRYKNIAILGARRSGKTTLLNALLEKADVERYYSSNPDSEADLTPEELLSTCYAGGLEPTLGISRPYFVKTKYLDKTYRIKIRDIEGQHIAVTEEDGGPRTYWEIDDPDTMWWQLFEKTKPIGVVFVLDHGTRNIEDHRKAFHWAYKTLSPAMSFHASVCSCMLIVVNKFDTWPEYIREKGADGMREILSRYRSQTEALNKIGIPTMNTYGNTKYFLDGSVPLLNDFERFLRRIY